MASMTCRSIVALLVIAGGINLVVGCDYGRSLSCPGNSCVDIYYKNSESHGLSGQYIVKVGSHYQFVHCDMDLECGGEKGWMRIAYTNAAGADNCPNGWRKITSPTGACRAPSDNAGCYSAHFSTHNIPYRRVCGMVVGYQKGTTDGFASVVGSTSINNPYLDGVSITYGTSRKHIWSYGAGVSENYGQDQRVTCPCSLHHGASPPSFVRDHFYCEAGTANNGLYHDTYFTSDPLWDGHGCSTSSSCCAQPNLPWFYRQIPLTSNENLEARICYDQAFGDEAVLVKEIQLYVQ